MKNDYEIRGAVTAIFITAKGSDFEAIIDTVDLDQLLAINKAWGVKFLTTGKVGYIRATHKEWVDGRRKSHDILLHRLITKSPDDLLVDHKDRNPLNNTKGNLRFATVAENNQNISSIGYGKSGIRGVHYATTNKKWCACLRLHGKPHILGYFDDIKEAEKVVKAARAKHMPFSEEALLASTT